MRRKTRNRPLATSRRPGDSLTAMERNSQPWPSYGRLLAFPGVLPFLYNMGCVALLVRAGKVACRRGTELLLADGVGSCIFILDTLAGSRYHTSPALDDGDARQAC